MTKTERARAHPVIFMELDKGQQPTISIIIPTLNSEKTLGSCLERITHQDYPKDKIEIIIADGGSTDKTIKIAEKYKVDKILENPLRTGEAGKSVGLKNAKNDVTVFIDSDNLLPAKDWLRKMVKPLGMGHIAGSEPLYFTYRKSDGYINRYCALLGMNDPLCLFIGNYDRYSHLTGRWTDLDLRWRDEGEYLTLELESARALPTIGANGFLVKKKLLDKCSIEDYFFDIDVTYELVSKGHNKFAKVKIGIIHIYSDSIHNFLKKQRRRISDYLCYNKSGLRKYPWSVVDRKKVLKFIVYTVFTVPILLQSIKGYLKIKDRAWFFHPIACWLTLMIYTSEVLKSFLKKR